MLFLLLLGFLIGQAFGGVLVALIVHRPDVAVVWLLGSAIGLSIFSAGALLMEVFLRKKDA